MLVTRYRVWIDNWIHCTPITCNYKQLRQSHWITHSTTHIKVFYDFTSHCLVTTSNNEDCSSSTFTSLLASKWHKNTFAVRSIKLLLALTSRVNLGLRSHQDFWPSFIFSPRHVYVWEMGSPLQWGEGLIFLWRCHVCCTVLFWVTFSHSQCHVMTDSQLARQSWCPAHQGPKTRLAWTTQKTPLPRIPILWIICEAGCCLAMALVLLTRKRVLVAMETCLLAVA
jgi:hypothetical protein